MSAQAEAAFAQIVATGSSKFLLDTAIADCRRIAAAALAEAMRPLFCDPRQIAVSLGYEVFGRIEPSEPLPKMASRIVYPWSADSRARGFAVFMELAERLLARRGAYPDLRKVCTVAAELAVPQAAVDGYGLVRLVESQAFAPVWLIEGQVLMRRGSGVRAFGA